MLLWLLSVGTLLFAFTCLLRLPFVLGDTSDEWVTWWVMVQQEGRKLTYKVHDGLKPAVLGYPRLQYYLLSRLPRRSWRLAGNLLNIGYDGIAAVLIFAVSHHLLGLGREPAEALYGAAIVTLLFSTSPVLLPVTARLNGIKARTQGGLLYIVYFLLLGGAFVGGEMLLYPLIPVVGILIVLSSVFALQGLAFTSLVLSALYLDLVPLLYFLASIGLGLLLPAVGVKEILVQRYHHYRWYFKNFEGTKVARRNDFIRWFDLLRRGSVKSAVRMMVADLTPFILLYSVPTLLLLAGILLARPEGWGMVLGDTSARYALYVVASSVVAFILTSIPILLFLGQAERYFEYTVGFGAYLLVFVFVTLGLPLAVLQGVVVLQVTITLLLFVWVAAPRFVEATTPTFLADDRELGEFLRLLPEGPRILTVPAKLSYYLAGRLEDPRAKFYHMFVVHDDRGFDYMKEDLIAYNWPRPDFSHFHEKYGVNTVVGLKGRGSAEPWGGIDYDAAGGRRIFENAKYLVWAVDGAAPPGGPTSESSEGDGHPHPSSSLSGSG